MCKYCLMFGEIAEKHYMPWIVRRQAGSPQRPVMKAVPDHGPPSRYTGREETGEMQPGESVILAIYGTFLW